MRPYMKLLNSRQGRQRHVLGTMTIWLVYCSRMIKEEIELRHEVRSYTTISFRGH